MNVSDTMIEGICASDGISPAQYWNDNGEQSGERLLAVAMLEQAVSDLDKNRRSTQALARRTYVEAYRWVVSNDRSWPYSFVSICEMLDLPCGAIRARLLWPEEARKVERAAVAQTSRQRNDGDALDEALTA